MTIIGMHYSTNAVGEQTTTLHVADAFNVYYSDKQAGRGCVGQKVDTIYVGTYDCSSLKVGAEIEVYYDRAITTAKGTFQQIKLIDVVNK